MKKVTGKIVASVLAVAMVFSIPLVSKEADKQVKADDYVLSWSDEFNGEALNEGDWNIEVNGDGGGNNELQYYTRNARNIEVSNGTLKIHALKENYNGKNYTSGRITTKNKKTFLYGKVEARMKLPRFNGAWPAFWMLGNNIDSVKWPKCGEMDIMEAINDENKVYANLHWSYQNNQADTKGTGYNVGDRTAWHTYGMEWDEKTAKFYVDNNVYETYTISDSAEMQEFRAKQFIIFNLAIGGQWPGWNIDDSAFPDRSTMEVDWVRVYQKRQPVTETYLISEGYADVVEEAKGNFSTYACGTNSGWAGTANLSSHTETQHGATLETSAIGTGIWAVQAHSQELQAVAGNTYDLSTTLTSNIDKQVRIKVRGNDSDDFIFMDKTLYLKAGVPQTLTQKVTIPGNFDGFLKLDYGFGNNAENREALAENTALKVTISDTTMSTYKKNYGSRIIEDVTTSKNTPVATTKQNYEVVTNQNGEAVTNKNGEVVTVPVTTAKTESAVPTVKKATKKRSAKKMSITIKKVSGATGYVVKVFKTKKNAKALKKALVTKNIKKNKAKFTVKNKKLKNKKKLFVRVRVMKAKKADVTPSDWSAVKKVKIKK